MPKATPEEIDLKNQQTINYFMPFWLNNYRNNAEYINRAMSKKQFAHQIPFNDKDIHKHGVVLVASGPTLYEQREHLKDLNKSLVICCPTNYAFCLAHGLKPDIVCIADSHPLQVYDLFSVIGHWAGTNIVTSPNIHPLLHKVWPEEKIYWFKTYVQSKDGSLKNPFNDFQKMLFSNIPDHILQAGNVTNMSLILIELLRRAKRFEEHPKVFLVGYDLAFNEQTARVPKYFQEPDGRFSPYPLPPSKGSFIGRSMIKHEGTYTNIQMYGYRRSVLMLWQTVPWQMWNCSDKSLLTEVPYWSIKDLSEGKLPEALSDDYRREVWKKYQELPGPTTLDGKPLDETFSSGLNTTAVPSKEVVADKEES